MRHSNTSVGLFLFVLIAVPAFAQPIYVDDDANTNGNGDSWATAYKYLQDALEEAAGRPTGAAVRVAQGVYRPDQAENGSVAAGDRYATFRLKNGVVIAGGYAGIGAPDPDLRDVDAHFTILSGDLLANDGPDFTNMEENSYHVVTGNGAHANAVIDGFTITAGFANGPSLSDERNGAGMIVLAGYPTVTDCTFLGNVSAGYNSHGAGMYSEDSSTTVTDCTFIDNRSLEPYGARGGAMYNWRCTGMTITGCTFSKNHAYEAGAMYNLHEPVTVSDCVFLENWAVDGAGALVNNYSPSWFVNCRFLGNHSEGAGGAMTNTYGDPKFVNCVFAGNRSVWGPGVAYSYLSEWTMTNCVVVGNSSTLSIAGAFYIARCDALLTNCILWGNRGSYGDVAEGQFFDSNDYGPSAPVMNHSCIQGGWSGLGGVGIIDADPKLVRMPHDGGNGWGVGNDDDYGDVRLAAGSPCIDTGDSDADTDQVAAGIQALPADDADGNTRRMDDPVAPDLGAPPVVDMGAYEYQSDCNVNASVDSLDIQNGISADCNGNGVPDECEPADDCNGNGVQDICDLAGGTAADCNENGTLDVCDIASGTSVDANTNSIPDACERSLSGYWQFDFSLETGCYLIDEYLSETRYLRFSDEGELTESWMETGWQLVKVNYPSTDGPSVHRYRMDDMFTANTDRTISNISFAPYAGKLEFVEQVAVTDGDTMDFEVQGSESGRSLIQGDMNADGTGIQGAWRFIEAYDSLCGSFTATRLPGAPPALPTLIDLQAVGLELSSTDLARPGAVDVVERSYRISTSFLSQGTEIRYLLSDDLVADAGDLVIGTETVHATSNGVLGLHAGAGGSLTIPACIDPAETYHVLLVIDAAGQVTETSEANNTFAVPVTLTPAPLMADFDCDGDVDLDDYAIFEVCLTFSGPSDTPPFSECVEVFDLDDDFDVDLADFAGFQIVMGG